MHVEARRSDRYDRACVAWKSDESRRCRLILHGDDLTVRARIGAGEPRTDGEPRLRPTFFNVEIVSDVIRIEEFRLGEEKTAIRQHHVGACAIASTESCLVPGERHPVRRWCLAHFVAGIEENSVAEPPREQRDVAGVGELPPARHHFLR